MTPYEKVNLDIKERMSATIKSEIQQQINNRYKDIESMITNNMPPERAVATTESIQTQ